MSRTPNIDRIAAINAEEKRQLHATIKQLRAALTLHHELAEADRKNGDDAMWTSQYAHACEATAYALDQQFGDKA